MPKIAISYRRSDSSAITGRIFDRLVAHYGIASVFMDIDNIPFGIDFRKHIESTLLQSDVLIAVVGPQWVGSEGTDAARIAQATDPVRFEVEMAFGRAMPVIPVLIEGAKMPASTELPPSLHDFAFLNAAEVAVGRDFHSHMDRLIAAIDRSVAASENASTPRVAMANAVAGASAAGSSTGAPWSAYMTRYLVLPVVVLLVAHHLIVNSLNLNTLYLRAVCVVVPLCFGFFLFWRDRSRFGAAVLLGGAVGLIAIAGMNVSESLSSGDPILPATSYEKRETFEYAASICLCFVAGHMLARTLRLRLADKRGSHVT